MLSAINIKMRFLPKNDSIIINFVHLIECSDSFAAGSPDILICGNCREMFNDLVDMLEHKRDYCKLRFTCKCDTLNDEIDASCTECNPQPQNTTEELGEPPLIHAKCF